MSSVEYLLFSPVLFYVYSIDNFALYMTRLFMAPFKMAVLVQKFGDLLHKLYFLSDISQTGNGVSVSLLARLNRFTTRP